MEMKVKLPSNARGTGHTRSAHRHHGKEKNQARAPEDQKTGCPASLTSMNMMVVSLSPEGSIHPRHQTIRRIFVRRSGEGLQLGKACHGLFHPWDKERVKEFQLSLLTTSLQSSNTGIIGNNKVVKWFLIREGSFYAGKRPGPQARSRDPGPITEAKTIKDRLGEHPRFHE